MTDDPTWPPPAGPPTRSVPAGASASGGPPTPPGSAPDAAPGAARKPDEGPEPTGIIDLTSTQALPTEPSVHAPPPAGPAWFDGPVPEHPAEGPGVPSRADAPWGSDRAASAAGQAQRAAYVPPAAEETVTPGPGGPPQQGGTSAMVDPATLPPPPPPGVPRRRGRLWALVAALCLLSGIVGGVTGLYLDNRLHVGGGTLPPPGPGATARPAGSVANIAAKALPSVVTIKVRGADGAGTGSGFVIDGKGHVLTNNHVVEAAAGGGTIEVVLSNGDTEQARIVGRDVSYDLAVVRLARTDLTPLRLGPSDSVVVGDQVIAVGAPLGLEQTVTTGIVSALNRPVTPGAGDEASYINAIQTDAAINPGNSGGPLLDMDGKVIGINSAIARIPGTSGSTGGNIGLGFAIPSNVARRTADQLIATGKATHPVIGVLLDRTFSAEGARVADQPDAVTPGGPADKAGVQGGDVIVGFEGKRVRTPDQLIVSIRARGVGDTVTLTVQRGGQEVQLKMTLEADPKG